MMIKRDRVLNSIRRRPVDRLPSQANFTGRMRTKIAEYFKISEADVDTRFENHLLRVDIRYKKRIDSGTYTEYDWWGAGFDSADEGYRIQFHPLAGNTDLDVYEWPDPDSPGLMDDARRVIQKENEDRFVIPNLGFALFERAWSLRGLQQFMIDMALDPAWCEDLLERITLIQTTLARRFVEAGVHGGYFGDDLGAQKGMLFDPIVWRKIFKPRLKRMFDVFTDAGLPVIMHSDGDIKEIIPDLIDIGLTALNPCQPEVLNHTWLKKEFGKDLAFYGGLSTQEVLPRGTPQEVHTAAKACIADLASDGTGYIFGPSHRMMADIPMDNIAALLEAMEYCRNRRETRYE